MSFFDSVGLIILLIITLFLMMGLVFGLIADAKAAPFIPTNRKKIQTIAKLIRIELSKRKNSHLPLHFVDLGSGAGAVVLYIANQFGDQIVAHGVEYNPILVLISQLKARLSGTTNAHFKRNDLFSEDLTEYDVIFSYLMPKVMPKLEKKLENELNSTSCYITESFSLPNWEKTAEDNNVFVYYPQKS